MESEELTLITRGRRTGREHRVKVWYAREGDLLWLRTDERLPDWYLNLQGQQRCRVLIEGEEREGLLERSDTPDADLRHLVELWRAKYGPEWVQDWYVEKGRTPVRLRLLPA